MADPVCVIVYRQPQQLAMAAVQSAQQQAHSSAPAAPANAQAEAALAQLHMARWANATLSILRSCVAVPTVVVPASLLEWKQPLPMFVSVLIKHLHAAGSCLFVWMGFLHVVDGRTPGLEQTACYHVELIITAPNLPTSAQGVYGLHQPSQASIRTHYSSFLPKRAIQAPRTAQQGGNGGGSSSRVPTTIGSMTISADSTRRTIGTSANATGSKQVVEARLTALLEDADAWLGPPDAPQLPELPLPAQALAEALENHLRSSFLEPYSTSAAYRRVAAHLHSSYAARVEALMSGVQQKHLLPGSVGGLVAELGELGATMWAMASEALSSRSDGAGNSSRVVGLQASTSYVGKTGGHGGGMHAVANGQ